MPRDTPRAGLPGIRIVGVLLDPGAGGPMRRQQYREPRRCCGWSCRSSGCDDPRYCTILYMTAYAAEVPPLNLNRSSPPPGPDGLLARDEMKAFGICLGFLADCCCISPRSLT